LKWGTHFTDWRAVLYAAVIALMVSWVLPELVVWRLREKVVLYLVPPLYKLLGFPFRALRSLVFSPMPSSNGESALAEGEPAGEPAAGDDSEAHEVFRMAVRMRHMPVREIMTPRTKMVGVSHTASLKDVAQLSRESGYSRFPVYRGNRDQIMGVLHVKDLLSVMGRGSDESISLTDLVRPPFFIPETKTISDLMEEFRRSKTHIGIVLDEYGGTSGLVTLEDMVEELIGETYDEHERAGKEQPLFRWIDGRSAEVEAVMLVEEFNEELNLDIPEDEDFDTIGGFVTFALGKIPVADETFQTEGARITVLDADMRHVIRVRVDLEQEPSPRERA